MKAQTIKHVLSERELLALLNWELAAYEECSGCRFTALESGADGGWSDARLEADHQIDPTEQGITRRIVVETRRAFELAPR